jgi:hypothetical protein
MLDCMIKVHGNVGVKSGTQLDRFYENFFS